MASVMQLPDMHDWSLTTIKLDWITGSVTIHLRDGTGPRRLLASAVSELTIPRLAPWGKSQSINSVDGPTSDDAGPIGLRIEMQSGDVISLSAGAIELEAFSEN
ncbi:hypothetical protein [Sphingomonas oryzagri]|uniref:Uncharacterized protein n=1 Tax=Sphingomonas oryzagri TaxID=3042314 RepID=A0ABT6N093_9SPHN|nr:hypothetical protein [Sphingomonas oryzagri]MDH7638662.1 hypothetical protein [Sphingomonas oryzagri]